MTSSHGPTPKRFLIDRIITQAKLESTTLTDIEIRMLDFTESTASTKDLEAAHEFEREFDDEEYELKIATLLRNAYERDKKAGEAQLWDNALERIAGRDLYIHVMLERAGLEKSGPITLFSDWRFIAYGLLPAGMFLLAAAVIGLSPFGAKLIRNDVLRFLTAVLLIAAPFVLHRISRRASPKSKV